MKKLIWLTLATFFTIFATDFVIHGVLMKNAYIETATLWRTQEEMNGFFAWMLFGQFWVSMFFALIFTHGYKGGGWTEGLRYGLLMGAFQAGNLAIMHAVVPYPTFITLSWIGYGFIQAAITGAVTAWVYSKTTSKHATA